MSGMFPMRRCVLHYRAVRVSERSALAVAVRYRRSYSGLPRVNSENETSDPCHPDPSFVRVARYTAGTAGHKQTCGN